MKKRSRLEITLQVLFLVYKGTNKTTHIMNEAGISWVHLKDILDSLISQGFAEAVAPYEKRTKRDNRTNKVYEITDKGIGVLKYFKRAEELQLIDLKIPY